ncbi:MAG: hypothetical protein L0Y35_07845, partial [Flammeovirgaceae bacterium]|nr:hypothetical protein [Flammeovirgaceae bacterium]
MKLKVYGLGFMVVSVFSIGKAYSQDDLNGLTQKLASTVGAVQTASKSYEQQVSSPQPAVIKYSYDEVDQKGARTNYAYEFNLADIDPYAVREQAQKDVIQVICAVRNKQKMVKVSKNNETQSYDDQVIILAKDIDNARAIAEIVKKAIPPAEKVMASKLKLSGYDNMVAWLTSNIKDVSLGTKSYVQKVSKTNFVGGLEFIQKESDAKASKEDVYSLNLADINLNSLTFKVTGNKFAVAFETLEKAKYIGLRSNGEIKPYVNDISIYTNNVDEARDIKTVLNMVVPQALEKVKADMPNPASEVDALQKMKALVSNVAYGPKQITQTIEAQCNTRFIQTEQDPKATEKNEIKFNWIDMNPNADKIDVTGEKMFIEVFVTDKKKMVMHSKNDKFNSYDDEFKIYVTNIENGRRLKVLIDKTIEKCKTSYKEPFSKDAASATAWLKKTIADVTLEETTVKQTFETVEGDNNKIKYTSRTVNAKGSPGEEVFEFNLNDMNPMSV